MRTLLSVGIDALVFEMQSNVLIEYKEEKALSCILNPLELFILILIKSTTSRHYELLIPHIFTQNSNGIAGFVASHSK